MNNDSYRRCDALSLLCAAACLAVSISLSANATPWAPRSGNAKLVSNLMTLLGMMSSDFRCPGKILEYLKASSGHISSNNKAIAGWFHGRCSE
ncbi:hypothetical protein FH972_024722 [Carpinus fangiana]|uniref:Uncharacterized protein n=1 Tax=Carpinus fangiana TaxID=176857 RepID=A0A5N6KZI8_9ROSI|nr:hypothetical protein FH972_024722 [Carpinus fangiana]